MLYFIGFVRASCIEQLPPALKVTLLVSAVYLVVQIWDGHIDLDTVSRSPTPRAAQ